MNASNGAAFTHIYIYVLDQEKVEDVHRKDRVICLENDGHELVQIQQNQHPVTILSANWRREMVDS